MIVSFDSGIAEQVGVNGAILLQNIYFWVRKNKANDINFRDGKYWTYNSLNAFVELYPFFSVRNVRTTLSKLKVDGWILVGNYNNNRRDQTCWYTVTDKAVVEIDNCSCQKRQMEMSKVTNGDVKSDISTNTDIKQKDINTDITHARAPEDCSPKLAEAMNNFAQMRTAIKKPMTDRAKQLMLNKLEKLAGSDDDLKIAILDQSIENSWAGVYPLKDNNRQVKNNKPESTSDVYNDGMAALKRMGLLDNESE